MAFRGFTTEMQLPKTRRLQDPPSTFKLQIYTQSFLNFSGFLNLFSNFLWTISSLLLGFALSNGKFETLLNLLKQSWQLKWLKLNQVFWSLQPVLQYIPWHRYRMLLVLISMLWQSGIVNLAEHKKWQDAIRQLNLKMIHLKILICGCDCRIWIR